MFTELYFKHAHVPDLTVILLTGTVAGRAPGIHTFKDTA